jgi:dihydrofolate reductase
MHNTLEQQELVVATLVSALKDFLFMGKEYLFKDKVAATNIACVEEDNVIGIKGQLGLPWHCGTDLRIFKGLTKDKIVVMGAETWATIPNGLPGRVVVVINRTKTGCSDKDPNVCYFKPERFGDMDELKAFIEEDFFIVGGGIIYAAYGSQADMEIVTKLDINIHDYVDLEENQLIRYTGINTTKDAVVQKLCGVPINVGGKEQMGSGNNPHAVVKGQTCNLTVECRAAG